MRLHGATFLAAAAAAIARSTAAAEDSSPDEALVQAAESVGLLCPSEAACKLDMGVAYGDPWVKAEAGDVGYFEV